ncbi:MAG: hypothetical protein HQK54_15585, partial [Oligoflexales bacterium]|nr:hypothetical protein [Oligoflexales bacterium]
EGGTGAASLSSIIHAGLPLERGVSDVHQTLVLNGIRDQVKLRADGGLKSGMEFAKIIALGAEEISIGTPLLIAEECIFCRGCSKGKCPVGIAGGDQDGQNKRFMKGVVRDGMSSDEAVFERYREARDGVVRYLECLGDHLRNILYSLNLRHPRELVGRVDLLYQVVTGNSKWDRLDLSDMLTDYKEYSQIHGEIRLNNHTVSAINREIVNIAGSVMDGSSDEVRADFRLRNSDHTIGATLAGEFAMRGGIKNGAAVHIHTHGFTGQGYGFAAVSGMNLYHEGYVNDGVGELISGNARIVIVPAPGHTCETSAHLVGNAAAYGATGGTVYIRGRTGQRFGVRNSGAILVCEGVGKYAFEYMTGGIAVVLGRCGSCVGSGMTGGEIFIYDPEGYNRLRLHGDVKIDTEPLDEARRESLRNLIQDYLEKTVSPAAKDVLSCWDEQIGCFLHVIPKD